MAAPEGAPLLRIEGLARRFGDRVALAGLELELRRGEILGLLGPNGAGKSTAFALLASLLKADAGALVLDGVRMSPGAAAFRRALGIVFQRGSLDGLLSARENLLLGARLYGLTGEFADARVDGMLELIELKDRQHERVETWSGGMRRRLELARALVHRPRLLLMDEPTQGLDEASFRTLWRHLHALRRTEGLTVLLTTHRADEAAECDRLAVLDQGRLVAVDSPAALASRLGGDVVTLEGGDPEALAREVSERFALPSRVEEGRVVIETPAGHALVPRLVEAFPLGRLASVSLRKPTLADVFLQLTGRTLGQDAPAPVPVKKRGRG